MLTSTERAIHRAAEELLAQRPPSDLTVAEIIKRAGSSRTTFYRGR